MHSYIKESFLIVLDFIKNYEYYMTKDFLDSRNRGTSHRKKVAKGQTLIERKTRRYITE